MAISFGSGTPPRTGKLYARWRRPRRSRGGRVIRQPDRRFRSASAARLTGCRRLKCRALTRYQRDGRPGLKSHFCRSESGTRNRHHSPHRRWYWHQDAEQIDISRHPWGGRIGSITNGISGWRAAVHRTVSSRRSQPSPMPSKWPKIQSPFSKRTVNSAPSLKGWSKAGS